MNWKLPAAIVFSGVLIAGGVLLPEALLSRQEAALYTRQENVEVAYSRFESQDSTLLQRLAAAQRAGSYVKLDFDVGAGLYWGREELLSRFAGELGALSRAMPSLPGLRYWADALISPTGKLAESTELGYLCVVDDSTGGTYVFAYLNAFGGDWLTVIMDAASGKLVCLADFPDQVLALNPNGSHMARELTDYLGLTLEEEQKDWQEEQDASEYWEADYWTAFTLTDPEGPEQISLMILRNPDQGLVLSTLGEWIYSGIRNMGGW